MSDEPERPRRAADLEPLSKQTALPPLTIGLAFALGGIIVWGTLFWKDAERTRVRQDTYISRDAVAANDPDYPC